MFKRPQQTSRGSRNYNRAPVTTYYRSKDPKSSRSPFVKKPKDHRRHYFAGAADALLILLLFALLIYSLLVSSSPAVTATSSAYHSIDDYTKQVAVSLGGVKNRNKITFDENSVSGKIQSHFPEVQTVQIELPFFSEQPRIKLVVSPPALKLTSNGQVYVVDADGVAVGLARDLPNFAGLPTVNDQSGFEFSAGKQVLSSQSVSFINTVVAQCVHAKVPIASLTLPAKPQEMDLRTKDHSYYVKFYLGGDANLQTGQLLAARHQFAKTHQNPAQYLDVRVSGKIFYK
ncbi:MAG TPA: hypothetical protein VHD84_01725 [Candidatus Saccharimonadales bacterium]|nr:hypothetical protein [Candidatus Saccharimonadales bacterium]